MCNSTKKQRATSTHCHRTSATRGSPCEQENEDGRRINSKLQTAAAGMILHTNRTSIALTQECCFTIKLREQGYLVNFRLS